MINVFSRYTLVFSILIYLIVLNDYTSFGQIPKKSNKKHTTTELENLKKIQKEELPSYFHEYNSLQKKFLAQDNQNSLISLYEVHLEYLFKTSSYDSLISTGHLIRKLLRNNPPEDFAYVNTMLAMTFYHKTNYDSLVYWERQAGKVISKQSPFYGNYLMVKALKCSFEESYVESISFYLKAAKIFKTQNDLKALAIIYNNIGINYGFIKNFLGEFEFLNKAIAINKKLNIKNALIKNYNNLGANYRKQNLPDEALKVYDLAYDEIRKLNQPMLLAQNLTNRANILEKKGDLTNAERYFLECEKISRVNGIVYGTLLSQLNLGNLYRQMKKYDQAKDRLELALKLSKELSAIRELTLTYERLAWLAKDEKNYEQAYSYISNFHALNDSLISESVKRKAAELKEKYETKVKEKEILSLSKQKLYHQFLITLMFLALLVLIIMLQWWKNKHKLAIEEKQKQELKKNYLIEVIRIRDNEISAQASQLIYIQKQLAQEKTKFLKEELDEKEKLDNEDLLFTNKSMAHIKQEFDLKLTSNNEGFFKALLQNHPSLSPSELKLCAYLRLNLSTKDLAIILNKSTRTIETSRTNIRKKMNLNPQDNLVTSLLSFVLEAVE
jgi:tetratricopeptide (TPR) repeat protein